jgi:hypothetical protein
MLGICFPHEWGKWYVHCGGGLFRLANKDEQAQRSCNHCNAKQEGFAK